MLGRTPDAAKQLASRARRRVRGSTADGASDPARQRAVVRAFLAASPPRATGDFAELLALLAPGVVLRADAAAVRAGATPRSAARSRLRRAGPGRVVGAGGRLPGAVWSVGGRPRVVLGFAVAEGRVVRIDLMADADRLG
ncbi:RNA polymerase sigma-70 factor, ECF subfamily [Modestobacter sp. DSM 44400]|uniref:hypothetical protein n=1 Tax=Modestobacter sp. DSM 44400 TaxID=1550230 RepID=UPI0008999342|nr:hypothetical protein [Modestobacter sp. DSM 44400]SDY34791.1 RNA polymerase sigma-70 factor, ECF subfamily [Modestobacter sp. DSM 44400]